MSVIIVGCSGAIAMNLTICLTIWQDSYELRQIQNASYLKLCDQWGQNLSWNQQKKKPYIALSFVKCFYAKCNKYTKASEVDLPETAN